VYYLCLISELVHVFPRLQLFITNTYSPCQGQDSIVLWPVRTPDLSAVYGTLTMTTDSRTTQLGNIPTTQPPNHPDFACALAFVHVLLMAHGLICIKSMMAALALFRPMKFALNCLLNICQSHSWAFNNQFWALPCTLFATQIVFVLARLKICLSNLFGVPL